MAPMRVLYKESPRTVVLYSETHSLHFRQVTSKNNEQVVAIEISSNNTIKKEEGYKTLINREVFGCLGLINVDKQVFLAVITGAMVNVANPVSYESVNKIYSVDFISLSKDTWDFVTLDSKGMPVINNDEEDETLYSTEPHPCIQLRNLLSNGSFYFSNDFDLTSLLQNRGVNKNQLDSNDIDHNAKINLEHYQQEYMWNSFMMEGLFNYKTNIDPTVQTIFDDNRFLTTVIRGFAKTTRLNSRGDSITIISKQSWKRAGTRFNARGIDDDGNVANFVETEFIYNHITKKSISSFIQIRGSVPAFWEQDSTLINPKITITRSLGATQPVFDSHFDDVCSKYGVCHIVNLLSKTKPQEVAVLNRYKQLYNNSSRNNELLYTEFDFHHETKQSGGFGGATKILPLLSNSLEQFGWFVYDCEIGEIITRQDGVFRVNCLDCLDRTNLIEQVISQHILENVLNNEGRGRYEPDDILTKSRTLWADNGDAISQIYTGTNALKSSFSRSGKMNLAGALSDVTKSVSRMYQNTFVDGRKQEIMDLMLGYDSKNSRAVRIYDPVSDFVHEKLKSVEDSFTSYSEITVFTGTFNVNATLPNRAFDLTTWLFPAENSNIPLPDIYAIGIQELIELNAGSILNADSSRPSKWAELIEQQLNSQNEQYLLLRIESIASMTVFLFVKKSKVHNITQVSGSSKKTGLGGITANKGACAVRFDYGATSFSLITSHLAAGTTAVVERYNDYSTIMSGLTFIRNMNIRDHDHIIWFGDLNFRIDLPNALTRSLVSEGDFDQLFENDQLNHQMNSKSGAFAGFIEAPINFNPTYKFDKGTSEYDTSEKQRVPSWTDRILFRCKKGVSPLIQLNYNSLMDIEISDHKPVFATFKSTVKFIDEPKKARLSKDIYESYKREHSGNNASVIENNSFSSSGSSNSNFTIDTLSELNLLDDFEPTPPRVPKRSTPNTNGLPRRVPPPPSSRKVSEITLANSSTPLPRKLPPRPTDIELKSNSVTDLPSQNPQISSPAPLPPPTRKVAPVPFGFSSTPLIPSRSGSSTPKPSPGATPQSTSPLKTSSTPTIPVNGSNKMTPMVPSKPSSLSATKVQTLEANSSINENKPSSPAPPPPRATTTNLKTMSDWKPLVPK